MNSKGHLSMLEISISMENIFDYSSVLTGALACIKVTHKHRLASSALNFWPVQVIPFPLYPSLQAQVKDPGVLVHSAFTVI